MTADSSALTVAVIGAGMIGSHVARELVVRGHRVVLLDAFPNRAYVSDLAGDEVVLEEGNATDFATVVDFLTRHQPNAVVHTAGLIGGVAQRSPWKAFQANVTSTTNMAEASRQAGVQRIVYISTQGVYDVERCRTEPMTEEAPTSAATVYPAGKLSAEHVLQAYSRVGSMDVTALRVANVYGRGHYVTGSIGGQAFNAMVEPVIISGHGYVLPGSKGLGEWVYVKDVARAVRLTLERELLVGFLVANIGTGELTTHGDVMTAVRGTYPDATFSEGDVPGMGPLRERYQPFDLTRAQETIGYTPEFLLPAGVADYIDEVRGYLARTAAVPAAG